MATRADTTDVAVIGGGVIGAAIALRLAEQGAQVTLIDRKHAGRASTAAAGMLSPLGERHPREFSALTQASLDLYPDFIATLTELTGETIEFARTGKLDAAYSADELEALQREYETADVEWLQRKAVLELEPELNPAVVRAVSLAQDSVVDNRALAQVLPRAAAALGVRAIDGFARSIVRGDTVEGVLLDDGNTIRCAVIVIAGGAWSPKLAKLPRTIPVIPVRGQMVALQCAPRPFRHLLQSKRCYLIPRSGDRILVGATVEHVGFDPHLTVNGIQSLLAAAVELVPTLRNAAVVETWTGFRPGTPDDLPILGEDPDLPGLVYATGHYRNGILLTPITGQLITELITTQTTSLPIDRFRIDRFEPNE